MFGDDLRFEEQPVPGTSLADLDPLLARAFQLEGEGDIETQLRRLHLLVWDGERWRGSVAGVLLTTVEPVRWLPSAYIEAVVYLGVDNDAELLAAKDFAGPLGHQIWDAYDFIYKHMLIGAEKSLGRIDRPEYSMRAVFEAVVNAVAHCDYSKSNACTRLHLFRDRMELSSPGPLSNSLSIESMREVSVPRNELITSLFARYFPTRESGLGREYLMDRRGAGVDVILRESERLSGRRPLYESHSDVELRLTIWAAPQPR
jgi:ATP-dependent DNA helicase RecG